MKESNFKQNKLADDQNGNSRSAQGYMNEFNFKHNSDGTITALRLKNNKYVALITFTIGDIPKLLADVTNRLPPEVRRYMDQVKG